MPNQGNGSDQGNDQISPKLSAQYAWRVSGLGDAKSASAATGIVVIEEDAAEAALAAELSASSDDDDATEPTELNSEEAYKLLFVPAEEIAALTDQVWNLDSSDGFDRQLELTKRLISLGTK